MDEDSSCPPRRQCRGPHLEGGGFPELHANPEIDPAQFYADYVATYLERDLRNALQVASLRDFDRFLHACANRTAEILNMADLGVSGPTIKSWMSALERSGQAVLLEPWFTNRLTGLGRRIKLHLCDSGTICHLTAHRAPEDLATSPLKDAIRESAVLGEIRRAQLARRGRWTLNYFHRRHQELDFVYERAGRLHVGDAKWSQEPSSRDAKQIRLVLEVLGDIATEVGTIFARSQGYYGIGRDVRVCAPWDAGACWF